MPYKSSGAALNDVVAGHVDISWVGSSSALPQIKAGAVKAFAAGSEKPRDLMPAVPLASEVGLAQSDNPVWQMLLAPAGTPQPIIDKLSLALREALATPEVQKSYENMGSQEYPLDEQTPQFANQLLKREVERMSRIIQDNKIVAGE